MSHSTVIIFLIFFKNLFRGLPVPEAEMLYMQEVEKMEGYGQETFQAKVGLWKPLDPLTSMTLAYKILLWS